MKSWMKWIITAVGSLWLLTGICGLITVDNFSDFQFPFATIAYLVTGFGLIFLAISFRSKLDSSRDGFHKTMFILAVALLTSGSAFILYDILRRFFWDIRT